MLFWKMLYLLMFFLGLGLFFISCFSHQPFFGWAIGLIIIAIIIQQTIKNLYTDIRMSKFPEFERLKQMQERSRIEILLDLFR